MRPSIPLAEKRLLTPEEAGELLGISRSTVYEHIRARRLRCVLLGASKRVTHTEIDRFVAALEAEADAIEQRGRRIASGFRRVS